MLWLYRILFLPVLVVASPYYLSRMRKRGGYRSHFGFRFGWGLRLPVKRAGVKRIWLQAVSVGEMLAIAPILKALKNRADVEVYLTTTTSTGFRVAKEQYAESVLAVGYFPIDWWWFSARTWRKVKPDLAIITEGERWPEHVRQAQRRSVPLLAINARLSDRSFARMKPWRGTVRSLFAGVTRVLAASEHDAERFRELGFAPERVVVTGNLKLDLTLPELSTADNRVWRERLGLGDSEILVGASTWPGEEKALIQVLRSVRAEFPSLRLLIVPRHAERRAEIEAELKDSGFTYHFRSRGEAPGEVDVAVADTTGELRYLIQLAEVVFVGKSLPPHDQGQTPVEAAAAGKPILFGPGMSNFRVIAGELTAAGAALTVVGIQELETAVRNLLASAERRQAMAEAAKGWQRANQGAVARTLAELERAAEVRR